MNENLLIAEEQFVNAAIGENVSILNEIRRKEINISIYNRSINFVDSEISILEKDKFDFNRSGSVEEISSSLENELNKRLRANSYLLSDIRKCLDIFSEVSNSKSFKLLLATINTNKCRRFHVDYNNLRLLCTYSGPGTIWLPDQIIDRDALKAGKDNNEIVIDSSKIQQAKVGDILILKGAIFPIAGTNGVVHRSPTIQEAGISRLLLRIDNN